MASSDKKKPSGDILTDKEIKEISILNPSEINQKILLLLQTIKSSSDLHHELNIKTLSYIATLNKTYHDIIFPFFIDFIKSCNDRNIETLFEIISKAMLEEDRANLFYAIEERIVDLHKDQIDKINKILKTFNIKP